MDSGEVWLYGCIGGALPVLVRLAKNTFTGTPAFKFSGWVLAGAFAMVFLGGLIANLLNLDNIEIPNGTPELVTVLVGYSSLDILAGLSRVALGKIVPEEEQQDPPASEPANLVTFLGT